MSVLDSTDGIYTFVDLKRWFTASNILSLANYFNPIFEGKEYYRHVTRLIEDPQRTQVEETRLQIERALVAKVQEATQEVESLLEKCRREHKRLGVLQGIKVWGFDIALPTLLSLFALYKLGGALILFVSTLFTS